MRALTTRELNRALLARQLLLDRSSMSLTRAIEQVGGLQTQYSPSGYISLWSRMRNFERDSLTRALERRRVVQGWMMRATIHLESVRDYRLFTEAIRKGRREYWEGVTRRELDGVDMNKVVALVRKALRNGPRRQSELAQIVKEAGYPTPTAWYAAGIHVDLVRVPPSGTWDRPRADLYALADDWLPPSSVTEKEGLEHLVRRYLGAFGPATENDIANWAGLKVGAIRPTVQRIRLRRFLDEEGTELIDLPRAPLPDADVRAPARFIPTWEATLLTHARRTQILPEEYRPLIFNTKTPHSVPSFLIDGQVRGSWRYEKGKVKLEPFAPIPRTAKRELEEEAAALAAFHVG